MKSLAILFAIFFAALFFISYFPVHLFIPAFLLLSFAFYIFEDINMFKFYGLRGFINWLAGRKYEPKRAMSDDDVLAVAEAMGVVK